MNDLMTREQWLAERQTGVGGSDAAVVLGLSKWKTPYQLWQEKRGELPQQPDSWLLRWGRAMEPELRQHYADLTGREVSLAHGIVRHPEHPWMICTPDGGVGSDGSRERRLLEIKISRSADGWGEPGSDEIHPVYLPQAQHNMLVTGFRVCDVLFAVYGREPVLYTVPADDEIHDMLIEAEYIFWDHVILGTPPDPTDFADVISRWGKHSTAGAVTADNNVLRAVSELRELTHLMKEGEGRAEELKAIAMAALRESDTLIDVDGKVLVTWKEAKPPKRFDVASFTLAHPNLAASFIKEGSPNRRFLLKG